MMDDHVWTRFKKSLQLIVHLKPNKLHNVNVGYNAELMLLQVS